MIKYSGTNAKSSDGCLFRIKNRTYVMFAGECSRLDTVDILWSYNDGCAEYHTKDEWELSIVSMPNMYIEIWSDISYQHSVLYHSP